MLTVFSDSRWPEKTGIGNVLAAMKMYVPNDLSVVDLEIPGSVGSPMSPLAISRALNTYDAQDSVFWSAGFVPPLPGRFPSVVTVHDLTHLHFYSRKHALYYNWVYKPLYRRCTQIVCVSDYTRREFLEWSGISPDRVSTVYNGVTPEFYANEATYPCEFPYVLYPGNRRAYKNLDRLINAYAASRLPEKGIRLGLTGHPDSALTGLAGRLGIQDLLHFFGWVEDEELPALYRGALAVAFVSLYEGFGLPIIEAMASRVPVLTSNVSAMPEVAQDAAFIVDPYDVSAITKGLDRLAEDASLRDDLVARGMTRARAFDWRRSADQLWDVVERAAKGKTPAYGSAMQ